MRIHFRLVDVDAQSFLLRVSNNGLLTAILFFIFIHSDSDMERETTLYFFFSFENVFAAERENPQKRPDCRRMERREEKRFSPS